MGSLLVQVFTLKTRGYWSEIAAADLARIWRGLALDGG
jgi:hypothetical protein